MLVVKIIYSRNESLLVFKCWSVVLFYSKLALHIDWYNPSRKRKICIIISSLVCSKNDCLMKWSVLLHRLWQNSQWSNRSFCSCVFSVLMVHYSFIVWNTFVILQWFGSGPFTAVELEYRILEPFFDCNLAQFDPNYPPVLGQHSLHQFCQSLLSQTLMI